MHLRTLLLIYNILLLNGFFFFLKKHQCYHKSIFSGNWCSIKYCLDKHFCSGCFKSSLCLLSFILTVTWISVGLILWVGLPSGCPNFCLSQSCFQVLDLAGFCFLLIFPFCFFFLFLNKHYDAAFSIYCAGRDYLTSFMDKG